MQEFVKLDVQWLKINSFQSGAYESICVGGGSKKLFVPLPLFWKNIETFFNYV